MHLPHHLERDLTHVDGIGDGLIGGGQGARLLRRRRSGAAAAPARVAGSA